MNFTVDAEWVLTTAPDRRGPCQISFVDDPTLAVRKADEFAAQVMKHLAEPFAHDRSKWEAS